MALPLDDLSLLDGPPAAGDGADTGTGAPLQIPLDLIDEDPDQPRREFEEDSLRELSETIALRGVRQPVSVRPHPTMPGRWMLNFGARRYRASLLAGKDTIPAFVDATADSFDQVIENEQRQRLTPLELALFVQRQQQTGQSLAEIGRRLGKSRTYMSFVAALVDAPDWLIQVYREGRCRGLTELYELRRLHGRDPKAAEGLLRGTDEITRAALVAAKSHSAGQAQPGQLQPPAPGAGAIGTVRLEPSAGASRADTSSARALATSPVRTLGRAASVSAPSEHRVELHARWGEQPVRVRLDLPVSAVGLVIVQNLNDQQTREVPIAELSDLKLVLQQAFSS